MCRCIFERWHWRQVFTHDATFLLMSGQMYLLVISLRVAVAPGCDVLWTISKILFRNVAGTYNVVRMSLEISQYIVVSVLIVKS